MRDLTMGRVSGVIYYQTLNILAVGNSSQINNNSFGQNATAKFNPSMAIIIIVLISAFLFMGFFSIYVRRCTSSEDNANANNAGQQGRPGQVATAMPGQGLDKSVVENLPLVGYSLVKGLEGGKDLSECAVCLSDFEDDEDLRLLPKCGHVFHPDCIDMWLGSHSSCPLCRASVAPPSEVGKEVATEEFQSWVTSRGTAGTNDEEALIHDGPPVPPNGSILELLSREGADRILADSLRRDGDAGLARREGDDNGRSMRALNRTLSRNSASLRRASRGVEVSDRISAATQSGRFNPSTAAGAADSMFDNREKRNARSVGSSQSFNMALRRSSSVGMSGRYIRQLFGNYTDYFSPDSEQDGLRVDRSKLLGTQHVLSTKPALRRELSLNEVRNPDRIEIPVWENIDLNEESDRVSTIPAPSPNSESGELPLWGSRGLYYPGSAGRKYSSGELPRSPGMTLQGEASGPLYTRRKGKESAEERTKSDRWTFGQSLRRTFSLRRTSSDSRDAMESVSQQQGGKVDSSTKWYSHMLPASPGSASSLMKFTSPWAGAMKMRRSASSADISSTLNSPSTAFPQSLPVPDQQQQHQHQQQPPAYQEPIQIVTHQ